MMRLISFKPIGLNGLIGHATIELAIGLRLIDCAVLNGKNGPWVALPAKPVLDRGGKQVEAGGRRQYAPAAEWRDRQLQNKSSAQVLELVRQQHPDVLAGGTR
jgi:hypothetical protein